MVEAVEAKTRAASQQALYDRSSLLSVHVPLSCLLAVAAGRSVAELAGERLLWLAAG